jgi:hypothetical protein
VRASGDRTLAAVLGSFVHSAEDRDRFFSDAAWERARFSVVVEAGAGFRSVDVPPDMLCRPSGKAEGPDVVPRLSGVSAVATASEPKYLVPLA